MTAIILAIVLAVLAVGVAGLIAAAETAFTRLTSSRAEALAAAEAEDHPDSDADARVDELRSLTRRPLTNLASLALVMLAAQAGAVAAAWWAGAQIGNRSGSLIAVGLVAVLLFTVIAVARSRSLLAPDTTAVGMVPLLRALAPLGIITGGLVRFVRRSSNPAEPDPDVDEQQLLAIVEEAAAIDDVEEARIRRVVAFDDTKAGAIMTPRPDMVTVRSGFPISTALEVATLHGLSRIPVTASDGDIDDIIGAVHVKDLIKAHLGGRSVDVDLYLREVPIVPEAQRVAALLEDLKTSDMHLAVVVDEHGGVAGVVTLEDILEELVGEIEDEFDQPEPEPRLVDDRTIHVDGKFETEHLHEVLGIELAGDFRTIAGCVFNGLGRVPEVGDVLELDDPALSLRVLRMHGRRIADVEVTLPRPLEAEHPLRARADAAELEGAS